MDLRVFGMKIEGNEYAKVLSSDNDTRSLFKLRRISQEGDWQQGLATTHFRSYDLLVKAGLCFNLHPSGASAYDFQYTRITRHKVYLAEEEPKLAKFLQKEVRARYIERLTITKKAFALAEQESHLAIKYCKHSMTPGKDRHAIAQIDFKPTGEIRSMSYSLLSKIGKTQVLESRIAAKPGDKDYKLAEHQVLGDATAWFDHNTVQPKATMESLLEAITHKDPSFVISLISYCRAERPGELPTANSKLYK